MHLVKVICKVKSYSENFECHSMHFRTKKNVNISDSTKIYK